MNVIDLRPTNPKPTKAAARFFLICTRRMLRQLAAGNEHDRYAKKIDENRAKELEATGSPFDVERIKKLKESATKRQNTMTMRRDLEKEIGKLLIEVAPEIDATLPLAERCDLLRSRAKIN